MIPAAPSILPCPSAPACATNSRRLSAYVALVAILLAVLAAAPAHAAITAGASTSTAVGGVTSITLGKPAGVVAGDALVASVAVYGPYRINAPSGWSVIRDDLVASKLRHVSFLRIADSLEPSSYVFTLDSGSGKIAGGITAYTGVEGTAPVQAHAVATGFGDTAPTPSVTTSEPNARVVVAVSFAKGSISVTPDPTTTERWDISSSGASGHVVESADFPLAAAGPTGTKHPYNGGFAIDWIAQTIALRPATLAAPAITAAPASPGTSRTPSWTFTGEAGTTFQCRLDRGSEAIAGWDACASPTGYDLSGRADGTYTFSVRAIDAGGMASDATKSSYVLDTTSPSQPGIIAPSSPSRDRAPSWSFSGDAAATHACRLNRGATTVSDWATCTSPVFYDLGGEPDALYTLSVRATDAAGNTSTATSGYTLDTTAPAAPGITDSPASPGSPRSAEWKFGGEAGASLECRLDRESTAIVTWSTCSDSASYDLAGQPDGTYAFAVRATDSAGNVSASAMSSYVLDTTPPGQPVISALASPSKDPMPAWSFTGDTSATHACRLDRDATTVFGWASCTSPVSYDLTAQPDGSYTVSVRSIDAAGNTSTASSTYALDTTAPSAPVITASSASPGVTRAPTWKFDGDSGALLECRLDRDATVVATWSACSDSASYDLAGQPDGAYAFAIRATDAAGNVSATSTSSYVLDTTAPPAPSITAAPISPGATLTPSWSFDGEAGATLECRLDRGTTVVSAWTSCADTRSYDLSLEPDGKYTFSVRAIDAVGNVGPRATSGYELLTSRPAAPAITASPASPGRDRSPVWSFSGEPGETFYCQMAHGKTIVTPWTHCSAPQAYDLTSLPEGAYTFAVRARNEAGTYGPDATSSYVLDTSAPAAPTFTGEPAALGHDRAPAWTFAAEAGSKQECRVERDGAPLLGWYACDGGLTYDLGGAGDGTYVLLVRATDDAGNVSPSATSSYTLDTIAPASPTVNAQPTSPGREVAPSWGFSAEAGTVSECRLERDGGVVSDWQACSSPRGYDLTGADGTYAFLVRATDAAGNRSGATQASYRLLTAAPGSPAIVAGPGALGRGRHVSWSFADVAEASAECSLSRDGTMVEAWRPCTSPATYELGDDGRFAFTVRARNVVGTTGAPSASGYLLDTQPPDAPAFVSTPKRRDRDPTPVWRFASADGPRGGAVTVTCRLAGDGDEIMREPCASPAAFDLRKRADGRYRLSAWATDAAGNRSEVATDPYSFDTTPPDAPAIGEPRSDGAQGTVSWSFSSEDGATFECRVGSQDWQPCTSPHRLAHSATGNGEAPKLFVRATDDAGNVGEPTSAAYESAETAPAVAESAPAAVASAAGAVPTPTATPRPLSAAGSPAGRSPRIAASSEGKRRGARQYDKRTTATNPTREQQPFPATSSGDRHRRIKRKLAQVARTLRKAAAVVAENADKSVFPGTLIFIVFAFLSIQGRIDRNDPKLALAPMFADPELDFEDPARAVVSG